MIPGVDVSRWNGLVDFNKLKAQGNTFVIAKATDGIRGAPDVQFNRNRVASKNAGLIFGSYHFFQPEASVDEQVQNYFKATGSRIAGELPPTLDWEQALPSGMGPGIYKARALAFLQELERIENCTPMLYCSQSWIHEFGDMTAFKKYPLWVARYAPHVGNTGAWADYTFWQYADQNGLDLDFFNGTLADLQKLAAS